MDEYDSTYAPESPDLSAAPIPHTPTAAVHPQHQRYRGSVSHINPLSPTTPFSPSLPLQYSPSQPQPQLTALISTHQPSYFPAYGQPLVQSPTASQQENPYLRRPGSVSYPPHPQQHQQPQVDPPHDMASSAGKRVRRPKVVGQAVEQQGYSPEEEEETGEMEAEAERPVSKGGEVRRGDGPAMGIEVKTKFPVARIKRIMQADEDVGKVSQVVPPAVAKALELFMIALVTHSATEAKSRSSKRVTAQHLKQAVLHDEKFDFLTDIVSKVPDAPPPTAKDDSEGDGKKKRGGRKKRKGSEEP